MFVVNIKTQSKVAVLIEQLSKTDFKKITKSRFWFDWRKEQPYDIYKLTTEKGDEILGLMSLEFFDNERRIEIRLLALGKENVGEGREYAGITALLLAYAGKLSVQKYSDKAAISLVPKTLLRKYYMEKYGFMEAGLRIYLDGGSLFALIKKNGL